MGFLSVCLSVQCRHCVETVVPIVKHLSPSGSVVVLDVEPERRSMQLQWKPQRQHYTGNMETFLNFSSDKGWR